MKEQERAQREAVALRRAVPLSRWRELPEVVRAALLPPNPGTVPKRTSNAQKGPEIGGVSCA